MTKQDKAIVLKNHKYGESDLIVSLFTPQRGKWKGFAKGARRSKKRFGSGLEMGSHIQISYEEKPNRDLALLKEASFITFNPKWRSSWEAIAVASYALELVYKLSPEHQESSKKFLLLENFLSRLEVDSAVPLLFSFQKEWLHLSGWGSELDCCALCGRVWENKKTHSQLQGIFDHYWQHLLDKPLSSRKLLAEAVLL